MDGPLVALVTGANRGIGLEVCRQLAGLGYAVVLGSRDLAKGERAVAGLAPHGRVVHPYQLDVTDSESIERVVWAATLPDDGPTGGFFRDGRPLKW